MLIGSAFMDHHMSNQQNLYPSHKHINTNFQQSNNNSSHNLSGGHGPHGTAHGHGSATSFHAVSNTHLAKTKLFKQQAKNAVLASAAANSSGANYCTNANSSHHHSGSHHNVASLNHRANGPITSARNEPNHSLFVAGGMGSQMH